ncbi:MAG: type II secretion system protein [Candidatus Dojkabacteria bacterium]|uniref:Type II secretion system protein n=1 Tax=Candidatus Dojkabacteria bacterium TaxID=2099670 RepID=A0A952AG81_9BACT|nr:type II secretion system protein [Candidatus Dojkabacteria bacterium]WKZ28336.1 MAG: type II secretion system protein [Candidatus Dojkabacteria bacterium]
MRNRKTIKAFSLVEMLITIAIFGILIAMISQVILINIQVSRKTFIRSQIREELAEIGTLIQRDVRNARLIGECGETSLENRTINRCLMSHIEEFVWTDDCPGSSEGIKKICKKSVPDEQLLFESSDLITFERLNFEVNLSSGTDGTRSTILVTLYSSASNPNFDVNNQVRQIAVSTRNFTLGDFFVEPETEEPRPTSSPTQTTPTIPGR